MSFKISTGKVVKSNAPEDQYHNSTYNKGYNVSQGRDLGDNYLFKEIQVDDISAITDENTKWYWDFDMPIYQIASNLEEKRIKVICNTDPSIKADLGGIVEFKGQGKKIAEGSWLGILNVERSVEGKDEFSAEDFTVTPYQFLKMSDDKAFETAKIQVYTKLKRIREQYCIQNVYPVIGEGASFRENLPTCKRYKSNRKSTLRPLLLKKLRKWVVDEVGAIVTTEQVDGLPVECDDKIEMYASKGYRHYRKTGKFSIGVISSDKDALNSAKLVISPDTHHGKSHLKGRLKYPKAMLIEATDRDVGNVVLIPKGTSKEVKGYGFLFMLYQACLGKDGADYYCALGHLNKGFKFGDISAYKLLKPCKAAKEALQATIDKFAELLPYGVQYTDHMGNEIDVPTLEYMNTYFLTAYMKRAVTDKMDFYKLCKAMKVDTSKIEANNKLTPPQRTFVKNEDGWLEAKGLLEDLFTILDVGYSTKKKAELVEILTLAKESVALVLDKADRQFYTLKQKEK